MGTPWEPSGGTVPSARPFEQLPLPTLQLLQPAIFPLGADPERRPDTRHLYPGHSSWVPPPTPTLWTLAPRRFVLLPTLGPTVPGRATFPIGATRSAAGSSPPARRSSTAAAATCSRSPSPPPARSPRPRGTGPRWRRPGYAPAAGTRSHRSHTPTNGRPASRSSFRRWAAPAPGPAAHRSLGTLRRPTPYGR